jgi:hypothetical protein
MYFKNQEQAVSGPAAADLPTGAAVAVLAATTETAAAATVTAGREARGQLGKGAEGPKPIRKNIKSQEEQPI